MDSSLSTTGERGAQNLVLLNQARTAAQREQGQSGEHASKYGCIANVKVEPWIKKQGEEKIRRLEGENNANKEEIQRLRRELARQNNAYEEKIQVLEGENNAYKEKIQVLEGENNAYKEEIQVLKGELAREKEKAGEQLKNFSMQLRQSLYSACEHISSNTSRFVIVYSTNLFV